MKKEEQDQKELKSFNTQASTLCQALVAPLQTPRLFA
jgi:hypothetical protein